MEKIYDEIRKGWVLAYPEEIVRQNILSRMIKLLGYPKNMLAVEKDINQLPHLQEKEFNAKQRRLDIICFAKDIHPSFSLYPLLMIECKAKTFSKSVVEQVMGYNHYVKAFFVCIANDIKRKTLWHDSKTNKIMSVDFLPSYQDLIKAVKKRT